MWVKLYHSHGSSPQVLPTQCVCRNWETVGLGVGKTIALLALFELTNGRQRSCQFTAFEYNTGTYEWEVIRKVGVCGHSISL